MAEITEIDDLELKRMSSLCGAFVPGQFMHINDADDSVRRTHAQVHHITTPTRTEGRSLTNRTTLASAIPPKIRRLGAELPAHREQLEALVRGEELPKSSEFPHLAWEAIKVGLAQENFMHAKLNRHIDEIQASHGDIALLLDLNAELSGMKEESEEFSEKAREILDRLHARGIDIRGQNIGEIKRQTGSHESRIRSDIQIKFTTKVQYLMQQVESMNQILQNIIRSDSKLKEKTQQLPR